MNSKTTIAIIGAGHLGKSILKNLNEKGHEKIIATKRGDHNKIGVEKAEIIILATKEIDFEEISKEIKKARKGKLIISLGPTFTLEKLKNLFGPKNIRLISPVNPIDDLICYTSDEACSIEDDEIIKYIFGKNTEKLSEDKMPIATSYVLFRGVFNSFFDPLLKVAMDQGFDESLAKKMLGGMLISAGKEIGKGIKATDRLASASYNLNENSFTMKLYKNLKPAEDIVKELFEKTCSTFKN